MTRVIITEEPEAPGEDEVAGGFAGRHPEFAYVFGDAVRAFYIVGCLALDLFTPIQVLDLLPESDLWAALVLVPLFAFMAYLEYRLYRRLWPPRTKRLLVDG